MYLLGSSGPRDRVHTLPTAHYQYDLKMFQQDKEIPYHNGYLEGKKIIYGGIQFLFHHLQTNNRKVSDKFRFVLH